MKTAQTSTKIWAVVPAAGSGTRFSKTELKQYQTIENKTVLEHSLARLFELPLAGCVLAVNPHDSVIHTLPCIQDAKVHLCEGGRERVDSVLNGLEYLSKIASPEDYVLVHDAARPCVALESLKALLSAIEQNKTSAILAIPVRDTLKLANHHQIVKTVDRTALWQAQTPQIAKIAVLKKAIVYAIEQGQTITDEASALEYMSESVTIVQGRSDNIKITYPDDLALAKLILASQHNNT